MDEFFLKGCEYGALGLITLFLLTRGTSAIKELADSNRSLANAVAKLSDKVNAMDNRFLGIEHELRNIHSQLDTIKRK